MKISIGDKLPDATFQSMGEDGPLAHNMKDLTTGKKDSHLWTSRSIYKYMFNCTYAKFC
jgi:hypothetical protein